MSTQSNTATPPVTRGQMFTLSALADTFMTCYQGRDPSFTSRLNLFTLHLGEKVASEIDADDIDDVLEVLKQRGRLFNVGGNKRGGSVISTHKTLADATINRYRCTLQSVLTWARKRRLMPKTWVNPVVETQRLPENNARTRYLSEPEYEKLIKVSRLASWDKLTLLIMLAVTTGARRGTLLGLRWKDVDLDSGRAFCERTKNGEPFVLVLMPDVIQEFHRISTKTNPEDLVFCGRYPIKPMNFNKPWGQALKDAQIEGVVFHSLRHTHASWLAKRGAPLLAIADSLGRTVWLQRRNTNSAICSERRQHLKAVWAHTLVSRSYADEPLGDNKYRKANTK